MVSFWNEHTLPANGSSHLFLINGDLVKNVDKTNIKRYPHGVKRAGYTIVYNRNFIRTEVKLLHDVGNHKHEYPTEHHRGKNDRCRYSSDNLTSAPVSIIISNSFFGFECFIFVETAVRPDFVGHINH